MRAFKSVAVSISFSLAIAGIAVAGTRLRVTGDDVSLRPIGDINSEVLGSVNRGQVLEAVDWPCDGEWVSVRPPRELKFWIFADLVSDNVVNGSRVKVRGGPSVNYKAVATLSKGDKISVLGKTGEWYQIDPPDSAIVWINGKFVEAADGSSPVKAEPVVATPVQVATPAQAATPLPPPPPATAEALALPPPDPIPPQVAATTVEPVPAPSVPAGDQQPTIAQMRHETTPARIEEPQKQQEPPKQRELQQPADPPAVASMPSTRPTVAPATSLISSPRETPTARQVSTPVPAVNPQPAINVDRQPVPVAQPTVAVQQTTVATARQRITTVSPRSYPKQATPVRTQTEYLPAEGETRVMYTGELTSGGKLTITNRGEYRLVTRDAQGRAITLCFLSGSAEQFESLRGESVKVEGYQTWNTGARHPTVKVDSIIRVPSTGRER